MADSPNYTKYTEYYNVDTQKCSLNGDEICNDCYCGSGCAFCEAYLEARGETNKK